MRFLPILKFRPLAPCGVLAFALLVASIGTTNAESLVERANRGLVEVVAGSVYGTDAQMAEDLATVLDDGATRRILPVVGKGSLQNLLDLRALRGADLAIVQADVLDEVRARRTYPGIENAVSYIAKLYNAEFHLLARANIKSIADLAGKTVSVGSEGDGTAVTAARVFDLLKVKVEPVAYDSQLALEKLKAGEIDAMAYVSAKPAPLFAMLRPQDGLHFVAIPLQPNVAAAYIPARLDESDYPGLVTAQGPVDTVAVGTVLLAANLTAGSDRYRNVANFVEVFFTQFPKLLESPRHPKWNEVNLAAELPGWHRFGPADAWIKRNGGAPTMVNEQQLHDIFAKFLDERSKAAGQAMSAAQKDELFDQFKRWQSSKTP
jgi:TRAP-type uncharacterized transport system substrate-binding protein